MNNPQQAKAMTTKAVKKISLFYVAIAMICFFGWGDEIGDNKQNVVRELKDVSKRTGQEFYGYAAAAMTVMLMVKAIVTYPLYFWPLCREIEGFLQLEEALPVELRLPWAVTNVARAKKFVRVGLVVLTVLPTLAENYEPFKAFVTTVPTGFCNYLLPGCFSIIAIISHLRQHRTAALVAAEHAQVSSQGAEAGIHPLHDGHAYQVSAVSAIVGAVANNDVGDASVSEEDYFCDSVRAHICATVLVFLFTLAICGWGVCLWAEALIYDTD